MTGPAAAPHGHEHIFLALCNARPGEEEVFNRWYDDHHVGEVVRYLPGFVAGRRYRIDALQRAQLPYEYVAVYDLVTADVAGMHQALPSAIGKFTRSRGLDPAHQAWVYSRVAAGPAAPSQPTTAGALLFQFRDPLDGTDSGDESGVTREISRLGLANRAIHYRLHADQREAQEPRWRELTIYACDDAEIAALRAALPEHPAAPWLMTALRPRVE